MCAALKLDMKHTVPAANDAKAIDSITSNDAGSTYCYYAKYHEVVNTLTLNAMSIKKYSIIINSLCFLPELYFLLL